MPHPLPPWQTVYHDHRLRRLYGVWERVHTTLRELSRIREGRDATPSVGHIDTESVKTTKAGGPRGKVSGRKRHLLVDTTGLVLAIKVDEGDVHRRRGPRANLAERVPPHAARLGRRRVQRQIDRGHQDARGLDFGDRLASVIRLAGHLGAKKCTFTPHGGADGLRGAEGPLGRGAHLRLGGEVQAHGQG